MINVNDVIGNHDILFITLDTLRYDVAQQLYLQGRTPNLGRLLLPEGWEARHSPGNFTYAAHHAFFAGFLPTPVPPGKYGRPFAPVISCQRYHCAGKLRVRDGGHCLRARRAWLSDDLHRRCRVFQQTDAPRLRTAEYVPGEPLVA